MKITFHQDTDQKRENRIITLIVGFVFFTMLLLIYSFSYGLNDDAMLGSIVSGAYTGAPDAHMIYTNYPLSLILKWLYQIVPVISWWGLFLTGSIVLCTLLLLYRVLFFTENKCIKIMMGILTGIVFVIVLLEQYVMIHYTIVAAVYGGCGLFLFLTSEKKNEWKEIVHSNIGVCLCLYLCYMVRSNVFYLLLPYMVIAGIFRVLLEEPGWRTKAVLKYVPLILIIAADVLLLIGWNKLAYGSKAWQAYQTYNEDRTTLYDYTGIPTYESDLSLYKECELNGADEDVLRKYNLLLDNHVNGSILHAMAEYMSLKRADSISTKEAVKTAGIEYVYRSFNELDRPYNIITIVLYLLVCVCILLTGKVRQVFGVAASLLIRTMTWMYLIIQGRYPPRVTISLYLIELMILAAVLIQNVKSMELWQQSFKGAITKGQLVLGLICILLLPRAVVIGKDAKTLSDHAAALNNEWNTLTNYCNDREDNTYLLDVDSTLAYSDRVFESSNSAYENYILLGGWMSGTPLLQMKLEKEQIADLSGELVTKDSVFIVADKKGDLNWLQNYYKAQGQEVSVAEVDAIQVSDSQTFLVYSVTEEQR